MTAVRVYFLSLALLLMSFDVSAQRGSIELEDVYEKAKEAGGEARDLTSCGARKEIIDKIRLSRRGWARVRGESFEKQEVKGFENGYRSSTRGLGESDCRSNSFLAGSFSMALSVRTALLTEDKKKFIYLISETPSDSPVFNLVSTMWAKVSKTVTDCVDDIPQRKILLTDYREDIQRFVRNAQFENFVDPANPVGMDVMGFEHEKSASSPGPYCVDRMFAAGAYATILHEMMKTDSGAKGRWLFRSIADIKLR